MTETSEDRRERWQERAERARRPRDPWSVDQQRTEARKTIQQALDLLQQGEVEAADRVIVAGHHEGARRGAPMGVRLVEASAALTGGEL